MATMLGCIDGFNFRYFKGSTKFPALNSKRQKKKGTEEVLSGGMKSLDEGSLFLRCSAAKTRQDLQLPPVCLTALPDRTEHPCLPASLNALNHSRPTTSSTCQLSRLETKIRTSRA